MGGGVEEEMKEKWEKNRGRGILIVKGDKTVSLFELKEVEDDVSPFSMEIQGSVNRW